MREILSTKCCINICPIINHYIAMGAMRLRHCSTSRKVVGSIADGVIGIFHWPCPSGLSADLELTQPLTEMSTKNISWGTQAAGAYGWQPYYLHVPTVLKSESPNLLEPSWSVQAGNEIALSFYIAMDIFIFHVFLLYCTIPMNHWACCHKKGWNYQNNNKFCFETRRIMNTEGWGTFYIN